jgi:hypothetical protein
LKRDSWNISSRRRTSATTRDGASKSVARGAAGIEFHGKFPQNKSDGIFSTMCAAEHTAESGRKDTSSAASFYVLGAADDVYDLENKKWTERMRITILLAMSIYKGERARSFAAGEFI